LNAAELATHSERALGVGAGFFYGESVHLARGEGVRPHDTALKLRPAPVVERERTDAFVAACAETMRELC